MAYNAATIKQIDPPDIAQGRIRVIVAFTGTGVPEVDQDFYLDGSQTAAQLQAQVANKATALNTVVSTRAAISLNQSISITPPVITPTQTQLDIQAFQTDWTLLQKAVRAVATGSTITGTEPEITALKSRVNTEWQTVVTDLGLNAALTYL